MNETKELEDREFQVTLTNIHKDLKEILNMGVTELKDWHKVTNGISRSKPKYIKWKFHYIGLKANYVPQKRKTVNLETLEQKLSKTKDREKNLWKKLSERRDSISF